MYEVSMMSRSVLKYTNLGNGQVSFSISPNMNEFFEVGLVLPHLDSNIYSCYDGCEIILCNCK